MSGRPDKAAATETGGRTALREGTVRATLCGGDRRDGHGQGRRQNRRWQPAPGCSSVDVEALARNAARMIEEGGKALAAYMKPREEGKIKADTAEDVADVVKTVGKVAEYWLTDPQRALELQTSLGRAYLDLWENAVKRMAGEQAAGGRRPRYQGQALRRPGMVAEPVLRLPQAGLPADGAVGRASGQGRRRHRRAHPRQGRILRQADRQRDLAVEFRPDQSGAAARDPVVERREPGARHAYAHRGHQGRHGATSRSASPTRPASRSGATWRSPPARSSSRTT